MAAPKTLWLIGCGAMAGAMLRRWIASGAVAAGNVFVLNRSDRELPAGVRQGRVLPDGDLPDAILLGVKPQQLDEVAPNISGRIAGAPLLVSILAGVEEAAIAARFDVQAIVRAMPNLPVEIGKGVVALHSHGANPTARSMAQDLMAPLGLVEWVAAERFDAVTALAGSGPAFVYRFIDALAQAGQALDIPSDQALRLALATVEGGALLAAQSPESPVKLADLVASPGGSTRKGLDVLDDQSALIDLLARTLQASANHNKAMADAAR